MSKPIHTLIIHGWSDCSESFKGMKVYLQKHGTGTAETIYESREDNMTYEDVVEGLNNELVQRELINNDGSSSYDLTCQSYSPKNNLHKYQQFLIHAVYYQEQSAMDFSVPLKSQFDNRVLNEEPQMDKTDEEERNSPEYQYSIRINELLNAEVHTYSVDSSYSRLLVDTE